ncbi:unnamed protein product [Heligmosomoides polygyrus]|uniref:Transposase n=1 Tax=Heligmosomoides polygyrus TaxID=6339 RepID=A0A183GRZ9_HELPZ|nr:unnamed protein product [Heligmosomoides polygyrus]
MSPQHVASRRSASKYKRGLDPVLGIYHGQIINDRITAVAADLHERGRRWADMFAEEDARAIETLTIETYGESDQEAAVREEQRKEKDRKRIDLITALSRE